ncbi:1,4-alpha-glucan branching protein GlgB [Bacillus sp. 31A1R]|uniref:1,4-alpha-glucan branching enzyme GlgB n=1 Tax=Robertmurraya mangrovi TaxID=3098077 RepID=A0ABU5IZP1_9BACI|nr:1,4-alpha-glucan branching protein GlgB [Bacillus sp. 31A1R]MDZ5472634.1 1,4-alpha-glucan branching protein GlgB [Bacillus sp. 31A1R]
MSVDLLIPTNYQVHLFHEGNYFESYRLFGAHVIHTNNKLCTRFCVWAPNAKNVQLLGDFNSWNGTGYSFEKLNNEGIWMLIVEQDLEGSYYKYEITTSNGEKLIKSDPFAFYSEVRPNTASIVYTLDGYQWKDQRWLQMKNRKKVYSNAMVIYELHIGSWKKKEDGTFLTYCELANDLIPYVLDHGFTHIELLPLVEHPLDISWGYQGTGYYSVTSRYGTPHDLMYFIDLCHQNNIGVIMDWVPGHFCKDEHGLHRFDGTYLYEYETVMDRENFTWGTANFDLGKTEVQSYLISNARFWMEYYHIDGFRVDAVSNIIFWPNSENKENTFGTDFLKKLNKTVFHYDSSVLMIAEDSTDWPQVTAPIHYGGLGFNYKWNMGWMNDILDYMESHPNERSKLHEKVTFSLMYAFSENFVLPFSHDEVVHGKKSLLNKMPGDYWEKFAQLRLLLGFMMAHPGKKLLFMGFEFGQFSEWKDKEQLDWNLLDFEMHRKTNDYVKELMKIYKRSKPLFELDHLSEGFEWIDVHNYNQSIFSFIRKGNLEDDFLVIVCNFKNHTYEDYIVGVPKAGSYREVFNSNEIQFGGTGVVNKKVILAEDKVFHGKPFSIKMTIPPFGISILRPVKHRKERKGNGKEEVRSNVISRRKGKQA